MAYDLRNVVTALIQRSDTGIVGSLQQLLNSDTARIANLESDLPNYLTKFAQLPGTLYAGLVWASNTLTLKAAPSMPIAFQLWTNSTTPVLGAEIAQTNTADQVTLRSNAGQLNLTANTAATVITSGANAVSVNNLNTTVLGPTVLNGATSVVGNLSASGTATITGSLTTGTLLPLGDISFPYGWLLKFQRDSAAQAQLIFKAPTGGNVTTLTLGDQTSYTSAFSHQSTATVILVNNKLSVNGPVYSPALYDNGARVYSINNPPPASSTSPLAAYYIKMNMWASVLAGTISNGLSSGSITVPLSGYGFGSNFTAGLTSGKYVVNMTLSHIFSAATRSSQNLNLHVQVANNGNALFNLFLVNSATSFIISWAAVPTTDVDYQPVLDITIFDTTKQTVIN